MSAMGHVHEWCYVLGTADQSQSADGSGKILQIVPHCIADGEIKFGYAGEPFELTAKGNWDGIVAHFMRIGKILAKARDALREIQDFLTLGADCLWITFADQYLWWAFIEPGVSIVASLQSGQAVRTRRTVNGWHKDNHFSCKDLEIYLSQGMHLDVAGRVGISQ